MSHLIVCRECNTPNAPGSRFCNNCGARLPLSTNLVCPNCGTSNPRNRVFCDNCGTRLIREETPKTPDKPEEPASGGTKAFSLPARPPGETGELDPKTLPDWLKTGDTGTASADDVEGDEQTDELPEWLQASLIAKGADPDKLPRLEELTPEKRTTDDLPDWLVNESDTSPIIDSPKEISTEIYLDLVSRAEEAPDEADPFAGNEADLPDWLAEATSFPDLTPAGSDEHDETPAETEPVDHAGPVMASEAGDQTDLTNWLTDAEAFAESPVGEAVEPSGLTDWLKDPDAFADSGETNSVGDAGLTDWPAEMEDSAGEPADAVSDLTGWLTDPDLFADTEATAEDDTGEAELAEWLADLDQLGEANKVDSGEEEEVTGADVADAGLPETDANETLPDWLAGIAEGDTLVTSDQVEEEFDDLYADEQKFAESELEWLAETGGLTAEDEDKDDWPVARHDDTGEFDPEAVPEPEQLTPAGDLDWLAELAAFDEDSPAVAQTAAEEEQDEAAQPADPLSSNLSLHDEPSVTETKVDSEPEQAKAVTESDDKWLRMDSFVAEDPVVEEELPDWLEQLGPPVSNQPPESDVEAELREEPLVPSEDLPDWIASLRPNSSLLGSSLPSVLSAASPLSEPLEDIPEELVGAELPEWLQDIPIASTSPGPDVTPAEEESDIPDWLITGGTPAEGRDTSDISGAHGLGSDQSGLTGRVGQEWGNILDDLPPAVPLEQTLAKADIPDWLQALKPRELLGQPSDTQAEVAEEPTESEQSVPASGPLAGMQGVVAIEPVILKPRTPTMLGHLTISASPTLEQQQQIALMRQLARSEPQAAKAVMPKLVHSATLTGVSSTDVSSSTTSLWLRLLLAGILIAALLLGLLVPDLLAGQPASTPGDIEQVHAVIEAAAGRPVLVAFEYTPAFAGELTPQANLLLAQLEANSSVVLTLSQYAAGTALAAASSQDILHQDLGYLPGEAIGLRQLGNCLSHQASCEIIPGWLQRTDEQEALSDVALIIVFTGERNSLINWIEQVGTASDVPIVAGLTEALAPVAAPYLASRQLEGVLEGAMATSAYQQAYAPDVTAISRQPVVAQQLAQLVVAAFLLIGCLLYGITGTISKRSRKQIKP